METDNFQVDSSEEHIDEDVEMDCVHNDDDSKLESGCDNKEERENGNSNEEYGEDESEEGESDSPRSRRTARDGLGGTVLSS